MVFKLEDQEKQAIPNIERFMIIQNDIQMVFSHASKDQRDEASQPQQDSAFDDKWYSFHMGEE